MLCMNESVMPRTNLVNHVWRSTFPVHKLGETDAFTSYRVYLTTSVRSCWAIKTDGKKEQGFFIKSKSTYQYMRCIFIT